jgi:hypothetical protein
MKRFCGFPPTPEFAGDLDPAKGMQLHLEDAPSSPHLAQGALQGGAPRVEIRRRLLFPATVANLTQFLPVENLL